MRALGCLVAILLVPIMLLVGLSVVGTVTAIALPNLLNSHPAPAQAVANSVIDPVTLGMGMQTPAYHGWFWGDALLVAVIVVVLLAGVAGLIIALISRRPSRKEEMRMRDDEARLMQELHRGFTRMEQRVETLETILLDRAEHAADSRRAG